MKNVLMAGPNGVGKSTILEAAQELLPGQIDTVRGSSVLMQCVGVTTYEELGRIDDATKNTAFDQAMTELLATEPPAGQGIRIIDAHILYFDKGVCVPCDLPWMRALNGIVALRTNPRLVVDRIDHDATSGKRDRHIIPDTLTDIRQRVSLIAGYMTVNMEYAEEVSERYHIPMAVIDNDQTPLIIAQRLIDQIATFAPQVRRLRTDNKPTASDSPGTFNENPMLSYLEGMDTTPDDSDTSEENAKPEDGQTTSTGC